MADWPVWVGAIGGLMGVAAGIYTALSARSIERYRAKLKAEGYEHEVRFGRLHERRIDVIADVYDKLVAIESAFFSWIHPRDSTVDEARRRVTEVGTEFMRSYERSRIWLDEDLIDRIDAFILKLGEMETEIATYNRNHPMSTREQQEDGWMNMYMRVFADVPQLRKRIEERFRQMLGVIGPP